MDTVDHFAATLSYLQCVLLAKRQQIDIGGLKLKWIDFDILNTLLIHGLLQPSLLSQSLSVKRPAISKRLAYLRKHQLIDRQKKLADKRMSTISLTPEGKAIMDAVFKSHQAIAAQAKQILSQKEQVQFEALARKLATQLDDTSLRMI